MGKTFKSILLASAVVLAGMTSAQAADIEIYDAGWNGWYAGSLAGYAFGKSKVSGDDGPNGIAQFNGDGFSHKPDGFLRGMALGYNWQPSGEHWVLGLEGDVSLLNLRDRDFQDTINLDHGMETIISGMGTLRARAGFAADKFHIYGTGGLALAHIAQYAGDNDCVAAGLDQGCSGWDTNSAAFNHSRWNLGWTVGAGVEYKAMANWIVRGEYLYTDLGSYNARDLGDPTDQMKFSNHMHVARVGLIRTLGGPSSAGYEGESGGWTGPYAGLTAGYAFGDAKASGDDAPVSGPGQFNGDSFKQSLGGMAGGLVGGYAIAPFNENLIVGVESDVSLVDINKSTRENGTDDTGMQTVLTGLSTARVKLGYAQDDFHLYATGGLAMAHISQFAGDEDCAVGRCDAWDNAQAVMNFGKWDMGWTVGAGAEYRFVANWRARAEYLYADFGKYTAAGPLIANQSLSIRNDLHIARVGVIYEF